MKYIMKPMKRLAGVILFLITIGLMISPFFILFIICGIDRANHAMDVVMMFPLKLMTT